MRGTGVGILAGVVVALLASACGPGDASRPASIGTAPPPVLTSQAAAEDGTEPSNSPSPTAKPSSYKPSSRPSSPTTYATYGVTYRIAPGGSTVVGPAGGTLRRYQVAVQAGLSESVASVAGRVEQILGNTGQGWARGGQWRFQRVSNGPVDFIVELTTASDTEAICARYGLHTQGVVSCRGGRNVVINETRWRTGTDGVNSGSTRYSPEEYQILVINHEVGHALGHSHAGCPGSGAPAPVMMPQYFGLDGCVPNIWPYTATGEYLN